MNFNIYLEDDLGNNLIVIAEKLGKTRNSIVREAISDYINKQNSLQWSNIIKNFTGIDEGIEFESYRDDLLPPDDKEIFG
jgi:predicted transcriptional regulator